MLPPTHLQRADALAPVPEGNLDVHDVLGLGEGVLDLARPFVLHELRGARPPGLGLGRDAIERVPGRAAVASGLSAADVAAARAGAHVVGGGRHAHLGLGAHHHGVVNGGQGSLLFPGDELVRNYVVALCEVSTVRNYFVDARGARVLAVETGAVAAARVVIIPRVLAGAGAAVAAVVRTVLVVHAAVAVTVADAKNLLDWDPGGSDGDERKSVLGLAVKSERTLVRRSTTLRILSGNLERDAPIGNTSFGACHHADLWSNSHSRNARACRP